MNMPWRKSPGVVRRRIRFDQRDIDVRCTCSGVAKDRGNICLSQPCAKSTLALTVLERMKFTDIPSKHVSTVWQCPWGRNSRILLSIMIWKMIGQSNRRYRTEKSVQSPAVRLTKQLGVVGSEGQKLDHVLPFKYLR
jgi:hypothetical protein